MMGCIQLAAKTFLPVRENQQDLGARYPKNSKPTHSFISS